MGEEAKQEAPKEETKAPETAEAKKEEKVEENEKKEEPKPPAPLVLSMDLHCMGCVKKIERIILKIRGVEGVMTEMGQNQVTIKGVVEPEAVRGMVEKKTKRKVEILSPLPEAEGQPIPQVVASQVAATNTVELSVNMHCEACAAQLKRIILKMKGVATVETELSSSKVKVTGTMEAEKLVDYVYRRTRKQAKVIPQPEPEKPKEEEKPPDAPPAADEDKKEEAGDKAPEVLPQADNKEGGEGEGKVKEEGNQQAVQMVNSEEHQQSIQKMMYYSDYQPLYFIERVPPPQLFSDENPNACCIT